MPNSTIHPKDATHDFKVDACEFELECPRQWNELAVTADNDIRYCHECGKNVFRCRSQAQFDAHCSLGHCVAVPHRESRKSYLFGMAPPVELLRTTLDQYWE